MEKEADEQAVFVRERRGLLTFHFAYGLHTRDSSVKIWRSSVSSETAKCLVTAKRIDDLHAAVADTTRLLRDMAGETVVASAPVIITTSHGGGLGRTVNVRAIAAKFIDQWSIGGRTRRRGPTS